MADHSTSPTSEQRVSKRATKGVPPARFGAADVVASTKKSSKRSSSSKESARQRKDAQAKRDGEIAQLMADHAEMKRKKKVLAVQIRKTQRELEQVKKTTDAQSVDDEAVSKLEQILAESTDAMDILEASLESLEATQEYQLAAIDSKYQAELERITSEEEFLSSSEEDIEAMERTRRWAKTQQHNQDEDNISTHPSTLVGNVRIDQNGKTSLVWKAGKERTTLEDRLSFHTAEGKEPNLPNQRAPSPAQSGWYSEPSLEADGLHYNQPEGGDHRHQINTAGNSPQNVEREQGSDMVSQLVTALGQAFGTQRSELVVKAPIDKNLPKFDGNPGDWENFRSEYDRTTRKYKYEDSENLTRLRTALTGDALNAVKHLMANAANLNRIWENLEKRFGRPEYVLDYLVEKAKSTKPPDPAKPETIIEFGTAIDALVTNICAYNQHDYMANRQLVNEFVGKLPTSLRTQWHEWILDDTSRKPTLKFFSQWMERKVDAAIMAVKPKVSSHADEERKRGRTRAHGSVNATPGNEDDNCKAECPACGKANHKLAKCWKFTKMSVKDRWKIIREHKVCVSCLQGGHKSKECPDASKCPSDGCPHWHHPLLHSDEKRKTSTAIATPANTEEQARPPSRQQEETNADGGGINVAIIEGVDGPLQIFPVKLRKTGSRRILYTYALVDNAATRSLILKSLSDDLGLEGDSIGKYRYSGVGTEKTTVSNAKRVTCEASGTFHGARFQTVNNCVTVDKIQTTPYSFNMDEARKVWRHLRKVEGQSLVKVVPGIIIGNNNPELQLPNRILRGSIGDPVALRTVFGWTITGDFEVQPGHGAINVICGEEATNDCFHTMKALGTTGSFGVNAQQQKGSTMEEKRACKILEETTKKLPEEWEAGLLWSEGNGQFADTEREALRCLVYEEKMARDPTFKNKYIDKFAEYLQKGYMKKLTPQEAAIRPHHTRYIPQLALINPNKPDKFTFIQDAKAEEHGILLNDKLLKGPELISSLVSVLRSFGVHSTILTGDISSMYHRIHIRKEDRCSQRLFWCGGDTSRAPDHYEMEVLFGSTFSQSSFIYVKDKNAEEFAKVCSSFSAGNPAAASAIETDFYSDDILLQENIPANRQMCRLLMSFYDPLAFKKIPRKVIDFSINSEDLAVAEQTLMKYAQWDEYSKEIQDLSTGKLVGKRSSLWRLDPILDNRGVLRVNGLIGAANVGETMKFPAILPQKHYITELIIDREHKSFAHQGAESVLTSLRQKYWIPEGRKAIQRSWTRCQTCRLRRAKPIPPKMGNLPYFRLAGHQPAFTYTGLDFFGPLVVTVGRRHEKRWGALFCCEVTRAVHLEIFHGLSTDEVTLAISRFVDSRGRPAVIISDNRTNFVGAAKELKENLRNVDFERVKKLGRFQEIKWVFNPPAAPHMGGSWERLVQTVKKCLGAVLHEKYPKDTTLLTLFKSVENMVNSRPLTHVSNDPADPAPITPNHILRGGTDVGPGIPAKMDYSDEFVRAQWRRSQLLADQFWTRWTREFLPKLLKRDKWHRAAVPLEIGELVYLVDDILPRNCWQRGVISAVFPGAYGQVRVVEVTTKDSSSKKATVYKRPTTKICPMGLKMEIQDSKEP